MRGTLSTQIVRPRKVTGKRARYCPKETRLQREPTISTDDDAILVAGGAMIMGDNTRIEWTEDQKDAARIAVNVEVRFGRLPRPNTLPCTDCGHIWKPGERRHEYDHHNGYAPEHYLDVEPVCTTCHARRDSSKMRQTHCVHGHEFTPENTIRKTNGTRGCRECRRAHDRSRGRDGAYWRAYRAKRTAHGR